MVFGTKSYTINTITGMGEFGLDEETSYNNNVSGNTFINNATGYMQKANSGVMYSSQVICNSFYLGSGSNIGFYLSMPAGGTYSVVGLGSSSAPTGNKFVGSGTGLASTAPFVNYYKDGSEPSFTTSSPGTSLIVMQGASGPPNCTTTRGYPAGNRMAASDETSLSVFEKQGHLKYKTAGPADLQAYQIDIANYYESNKNLAGLETYAGSLVNCNRQSYYILMLHLMNKYYASGDLTSSERCKTAVLKVDPKEEEIKNIIKYFEVTKRGHLANFSKLNIADSTDLASIATSGTSFAKIALVNLQFAYPNYTCNTDIAYVPNYNKINCESQNPAARKAAHVETNGGALENAVPNPATNETVISYTLADANSDAAIEIHDVATGRVIKYISLSQGDKTAQSINLNVNGFASGIYSYRLWVNGKVADTKKLVVIK